MVKPVHSGSVLPQNNQRFSRRLAQLGTVLAVLACLSLFIDRPVATLARQNQHQGVFRHLNKLLDLAEAYAHSYSVALILLVAHVLEEKRRGVALRIAVCAFGAGLAADTAKLLVARLRPVQIPLDAPIWDSFVAFMPLLSGTGTEVRYGSAIQSMPSGHTATAVGLAIGLSWCYPRGKWVFGGLAVLAGLQRIESANHYVSDCLAGAAIACFVGTICAGNNRLGAFLMRRSEPRLPPSASHADG